jgi:hypothetical protein
MNDKSDLITNAEERRIVEQLWQELKPLHELVHAYVRQQMAKIYPGHVQLDEPIPVHLTSNQLKNNNSFLNLFYFVEDLFGSLLTYLEHDILPFPHIKGIDLGPAMKRKVFFRKLIFSFLFLIFN